MGFCCISIPFHFNSFHFASRRCPSTYFSYLLCCAIHSLLLTAFRFCIYFLASQRSKPCPLASQPFIQASKVSDHHILPVKVPFYVNVSASCAYFSFATFESMLMAALQLSKIINMAATEEEHELWQLIRMASMSTVDILSSISCILCSFILIIYQ